MGFFFFFLLFIIQFCFPFGLPLFKILLCLFILKELLNGGQQCSCNRVKLIRYRLPGNGSRQNMIATGGEYLYGACCGSAAECFFGPLIYFILQK